jgi:hypothetical protein
MVDNFVQLHWLQYVASNYEEALPTHRTTVPFQAIYKAQAKVTDKFLESIFDAKSGSAPSLVYG